MASAVSSSSSWFRLGFKVSESGSKKIRPLWCSTNGVVFSSSFTTFARGRRKKSATSAPTPRSPKPKAPLEVDDEVGDDNIDEDAFEALFSLLEEDLKNDGLSTNDADDDEITEEDLAKLEKELEEALGDEDFLEASGLQQSELDSVDTDDEEDERPKLKNWQLRRLATALKIGRRKVNIKNLAAELGLERAFVLELLREPPPDLLLMSASLPDNVVEPSVQKEKHVESFQMPVEEVDQTEPEVEIPPAEITTQNESQVKAPIHVMQTRWSAQKRLKKVQIETLEKVYNRTKRPTNAMISSIVHVTNLPGKRVVKWFEDRRAEDGIPEQRQPFHRHESRKR